MGNRAVREAPSNEPLPQTVTRTYVRYTLLAGSLPCEEHHSYRVDARDPEEHAKRFSDVVSLRYYDVQVTEVLIDGQTVEKESDPLNHSKIYIVGGKLMDLNDVIALGNRDELVVDMGREGWDKIVRYFHGGFMFERYDPDKHELISI